MQRGFDLGDSNVCSPSPPLNLIAVIDINGQQALGHTKAVLDIEPLEARWRAWDWDVHEVDGHDTEALTHTFQRLDTNPGKEGPPHVLIAKTTFGRGISFMQSKIERHYLPINDEQYEAAMKELDNPQ